MCGPGPSNAHPRVYQAMALPQVGHMDPAFLDIVEELKGMLRYVWQTNNAFTIPVSGTGRFVRFEFDCASGLKFDGSAWARGRPAYAVSVVALHVDSCGTSRVLRGDHFVWCGQRHTLHRFSRIGPASRLTSTPLLTQTSAA